MMYIFHRFQRWVHRDMTCPISLNAYVGYHVIIRVGHTKFYRRDNFNRRPIASVVISSSEIIAILEDTGEVKLDATKYSAMLKDPLK